MMQSGNRRIAVQIVRAFADAPQTPLRPRAAVKFYRPRNTTLI